MVPELTYERRQRLVIALAAVARVSSAVLLGTAMTVYIGRQASPFMVSLALTAFYLGLLFFAPVWGAVADVTGRRKHVLLLTTVLATGAILPLVAFHGVWAQIGSRFVYAVFGAGYGAVMLTIVSERGGADRRGESIGFYNSVVAGGAIGGRVLAGMILGYLLPGSTYLLIAGVSAVSGIAILLIDDPTPEKDASIALGDLLSEVRTRLLPKVGDREHLHRNGLSWLYVAIVLRNTTNKGIGSVLPFFLIAEVGMSEFVMGLVLAVSPGVRVFTTYLFGRLTDVIGRKPFITIGLTGAGFRAIVLTAALVPAAASLRIGLATLGSVIHAVTFSALTIGAVSFIGDVAPTERESELMGLRTTARGVGGVVGPLLVGGIATLWSYPAAFLGMCALAFVAAGIVHVTLVESHERDADLRDAIGSLRRARGD